MEYAAQKLNAWFRSTAWHLLGLFVIFFFLVLSIVGAIKFDESLTDYTGHELFRLCFGLAEYFAFFYVFWNWFSRTLDIFEEEIRSVASNFPRWVGAFIRGGSEALRKMKKEKEPENNIALEE